MKPFKLVDRELRPGCRQVTVIGELDLSVATELEAALDRLERDATVVIDFQECDFIDSTGIAVIIKAYQRFEEGGGRIAVYGASDQVHRILAITGLTENGLVFKNVYDALGSHG
jgi:anti-anti-sigma factor